MSLVIKIRNITRDFPLGSETVKVLKGIDLDIERGEYVALMGPSGSGKSTLMNLLGCLDTPTSGSYELNGKDVSSMSDDELAEIRNKEIGFVYQFHNLLAEFSAIENVCIPAFIAGKTKKEAMIEAEKFFDILQLRDRMKHKPSELSGGEQQRVAVARALINDPSIILADEPSGNLDSQNAKELHNLFFKLRDIYKKTFLIVTHNEELARMSDRELLIKDGLILS